MPPEPVADNGDEPPAEAIDFSTEPGRVAAVVAAFQRWLYLPDSRPLLAVLGAVAANRLDGDPVWLMLVGPPGGGKTEILAAVGDLADVHPTATLTEPALLSGTPKREKEEGTKGGLLRQIGEFGIIVCKDFGSVLSMHRDARAQVLAALREVYDGSWTRHVGTGGGKTLSWSGKVGLVAGCTPAIDRHHAVIGAMGERFVLMRLTTPDGDEQARRALAHAGREREMRAELARAVAGLFATAAPQPRGLDDRERDRLVMLATLVVKCRSSVERDGYSREIEFIPDSEAPTRLVITLERLLAGLDVIGIPRDEAWQVVGKVALDSMPELRHRVLKALHAAPDWSPTTDLAEAIQHPTNTTARALEDLTGHRIAERQKQGQGKANLWRLSAWARQRYSLIAPSSPEMSGGENRREERTATPSSSTSNALEDISGEVPPDEAERLADTAREAGL